MFDPNPELDALLSSLMHPQLRVIDPGLERVERLLGALGNPHHRLPPVIHVAGTNGKGSLLAFLQAMFEAEGYKVHRYSSPHLVRFAERIIVAGEPIDEPYLFELLKRVKAKQDEFPCTFFEATTVAAFLAFAERKADVVLLETGMGGRLDATNVIARPAAVAITPIGMDHAEFLGTTLEQIAGEKAAIIKPDVPAVIGPQEKIAYDVIVNNSQEVGGLLSSYNEDWSMKRLMSGDWQYEGKKWQYTFPTPKLAGNHQFYNAATAVAVLEAVAEILPVSEGSIRQGVTQATWPARLQRLESGYWNSLLPQNVPLYLDGGHNEMAAKILAEWAKQTGAKLHIVFGMLTTKDPELFLAQWKRVDCEFYVIPLPVDEPSYTAETLNICLKNNSINGDPYASIEDAMRGISAKPGENVLICGSLYLAGAVLARH